MIWVILLLTGSIHKYEYYEHLKEAKFGYPAPFNIPITPKKGLLYNYYGYLPYWVSTSLYNKFRYELLSHISYFSVAMHYNGTIGSIPNPDNFTDIVIMPIPVG